MGSSSIRNASARRPRRSENEGDEEGEEEEEDGEGGCDQNIVNPHDDRSAELKRPPSTPPHSECCPALEQGNKAPTPRHLLPLSVSQPPAVCVGPGICAAPQVDDRLLAVSARLNCVQSCGPFADPQPETDLSSTVVCVCWENRAPRLLYSFYLFFLPSFPPPSSFSLHSFSSSSSSSR